MVVPRSLERDRYEVQRQKRADSNVIMALFRRLPETGGAFPDRDKWLRAMEAVLGLVYPLPPPSAMDALLYQEGTVRLLKGY